MTTDEPTTVRQLREWLFNCPNQDAVVLVDGNNISEAYFDSLDSFQITSDGGDE